jgi:hypothetical protein
MIGDNVGPIKPTPPFAVVHANPRIIEAGA